MGRPAPMPARSADVADMAPDVRLEERIRHHAD